MMTETTLWYKRRFFFLSMVILAFASKDSIAQKSILRSEIISSHRIDTAKFSISNGAIVRGDATKKEIALVFTGDEFGEGLRFIAKALSKEEVKGSFFFTGRFYRNKLFQSSIKQLYRTGHYLGPHSDQHLLYCDWSKRDSLLVTEDSFKHDIQENIKAIRSLSIKTPKPLYFIPPYEWWNDSIAFWSKAEHLTLINFTPGIRTAADYTFLEMGASYKSSDWILNWLKEFTVSSPEKLNGSIVLIHAGTDPRRKDKLYYKLAGIVQYLKSQGYRFLRIDELLGG